MNENWTPLLTHHQRHSHPLDGTQPELFLCPLTDHAIATLVGEQSREYLQGQMTCDMNKLSDSNYLKSAHCDAKGKAWAVLDIFSHQDHFLLCAHHHELAASAAQLLKYGVFSKTTITATNTDWYCFGLGGPQAGQWLSDNWQVQFNEAISAADIADGKVVKLCDNSFLIVTKTPEQLISQFADLLFDKDLWDYWNIAAAKPYLTEATSGQYVPQMLNLQALDAISFDKGCYSGQEMVARMKYLGKNKRATYILEGKAQALPEDGHELQLSLGENWRRSGQVLNVAGTPENLHILAVLPNDLTEDALLRLKDDENSALSIKPLPYSLDAE